MDQEQPRQGRMSYHAHGAGVPALGNFCLVLRAEPAQWATLRIFGELYKGFCKDY